MRRRGRRYEEALRELEAVAQGFEFPNAKGVQPTALMRFTKHTEWQKASDLIIQALQGSLYRRLVTPPIPAPAGWLPPVV